MNEIDVPDWVVRKAAEVMENWHNSPLTNQGYNDALRAALTAALGAWLVPVAVSREHDASRPSFYDVVPNDSQEAEIWAYALVPLYTLRQEKPE